jgi:hypothetical protein
VPSVVHFVFVVLDCLIHSVLKDLLVVGSMFGIFAPCDEIDVCGDLEREKRDIFVNIFYVSRYFSFL